LRCLTGFANTWCSRYNLKRRVANLPPLSAEIFAEKVLANKASAAATAAKAAFEKPCSICQKTYFSANAYANHLNSQKHRANVSRGEKTASSVGRDDETASMMSSAFSLGEPTANSDAEAEEKFEEVIQKIKHASLADKTPVAQRPSRPHHSAQGDRPEHPIPKRDTVSPSKEEDDATSTTSTNKPKTDTLLTCLFCNYGSPTFTTNIEHMGRIHGMFIPEKEYLTDSEGLIKYLHHKINEFHECLYCGKAVHTATGIQTHMRDRGHCMIAFEHEEQLIEIGQFYDFRSTYPDADDFDDGDDSDSTASDGGIKLGAPRTTKTEGEAEDEGWETDSTLSDVPTDEITSIPIEDRSHRYALLNKSRHHSHSDPRPHRGPDGWHSHAHHTPHAVYHDEFELHLPSGRTAGHRSLNKYYRQNLRNYPSAAERMEQYQRRIEAGSADEDSDGDVVMEDGEQRGRARQGQLVTRANGGLGMVGVSDHVKKTVKATEKRERRREQRARNKYQAGNEKQGNFQKHFRVSPNILYTKIVSRDHANSRIGSAPAVIQPVRFGVVWTGTFLSFLPFLTVRGFRSAAQSFCHDCRRHCTMGLAL
jgi:pre-60S factor REI1